MIRTLRVALFVAVASTGLSLGLSPLASADDADTQFIGEVSYFLKGQYLDPATIKALVMDANKICDMSDAGFKDQAMVYIDSKWDPSDSIAFMAAATRAYCVGHLGDWQGL
jgi:hypothetical protein